MGWQLAHRANYGEIWHLKMLGRNLEMCRIPSKYGELGRNIPYFFLLTVHDTNWKKPTIFRQSWIPEDDTHTEQAMVGVGH